GLAMDRGVAVNEYLQTSAEGIYAAGDIARFPHASSGEKLRIEHWVVAQRQGQMAARNMLGRGERYDAVPFSWSMHYDLRLSYVGHASAWDEIERDGDLAGRNFSLKYKKAGRVLAVLTVGRDGESLSAELALERSRA